MFQTKILRFYTTDGVEINGILYTPEQETKTVIISTHGISSNMFKKRVEIMARRVAKENIACFTYNTRGAGIISYINKNNENGEKQKEFGGSAYEDILESYYDIKACMLELKSLGYTNIILQGHSLGSTKTVYTYNRMLEEKETLLENIKAVVLLSLVDIPSAQKYYLKERYGMYLAYAQTKKIEGKELELMPTESFMDPISVKTYLRLFKDNEKINIAKYSEPSYNFKELNNIKVPIMMRFGNNNEMILQKAEDLVETLKKKILNKKADIFFVDGADHGYNGKEEILATQIINFIKDNKIEQ